MNCASTGLPLPLNVRREDPMTRSETGGGEGMLLSVQAGAGGGLASITSIGG